jgi:hypothetical protein
MRLIAGILLLILGIGSISCRWQGATGNSPAATPSIPWVRTASGWERFDPNEATIVGPPTLHPLVVASGEALASILGLALYSAGPLLPARPVQQ